MRGTIFGGPYNKDCNILGSILGTLILGNYHIRVVLGLFIEIMENTMETTI